MGESITIDQVEDLGLNLHVLRAELAELFSERGEDPRSGVFRRVGLQQGLYVA